MVGTFFWFFSNIQTIYCADGNPRNNKWKDFKWSWALLPDVVWTFGGGGHQIQPNTVAV
jgi:hypothetical protein